MSANIQIKLLANCPEHIPALAQLWMDELGAKWIPNASTERAIAVYKEHLNTNDLPMTFVMVDGNKPIGMVSLRDNDGIREDLTPWLGSLIVHPDYRRKGLGEMLINVTMQRCKAMGYKKLYLFALDPALPAWYKALGWKEIGEDKLYHHPVTAMEILV